LLLNSFFYTLKALIKRERNVASEIYSYQSLFFLKKSDPVGYLESCRTNDNAFPEGIREKVYRLRDEVFKVDSLLTLEIGSGPNSNLSYWVDNKLLEVTAIDPLAPIYKKIMKKLNYQYPIAPIKLRGEDMLNFFEKESFHIIFAQNSLDHAENPIKCFKNAYLLLKKGGFLFICSNVKEGSRKSWTGMHKYDMFVENGEIFLANEKGEIRKFIDENMDIEFIFYETYSKNNVASFEAVFKKI
jgi:SAM-dependent methyltransferase